MCFTHRQRKAIQYVLFGKDKCSPVCACFVANSLGLHVTGDAGLHNKETESNACAVGSMLDFGMEQFIPKTVQVNVLRNNREYITFIYFILLHRTYISYVSYLCLFQPNGVLLFEGYYLRLAVQTHSVLTVCAVVLTPLYHKPGCHFYIF